MDSGFPPVPDEMKVPATEDVPRPRFVAPPAASRSSSVESMEDLQIVLGPRSALPGRLGTARRLHMSRDSIVSLANSTSTADCIRFSDYMRLTRPIPRAEGSRRPQAQLSVGSALHVGDGVNAMCLVCSYHKPPLRSCMKGAFCDFCHLHDGRRNRRRRGALFSGKELLLADDRARILGYKDGNVKVRVKQVDHATGRVCVGVDDGMQEAWVFKDELRPVEDQTGRMTWNDTELPVLQGILL
ncbi:unnamed protein product [Symbiodinium natans]|uniref:Uncharacterized protein n=1 Tax=Symbiodinium natans TaxID=878477 RepID=A0A812J623_9DINO|nr:unnamed protein product [Symbiodinium natans]